MLQTTQIPVSGATKPKDDQFVDIVFPVTLEVFLAKQAELTGRPLDQREKETAAEWLPIFNEAYTDGLEDKEAHHWRAMRSIRALQAANKDRPQVFRFLDAAVQWAAYAYRQGRVVRGGAAND